MPTDIFKLLKLPLRPFSVNYRRLLNRGAFIIDVRTLDEYKKEHIAGSMNMPISMLKEYINMMKDKKRPIITCCESGIKSRMAERILMSNGYEQVYSAGNWRRLNAVIFPG